MIAHSIEAAKASPLISRVIVSTDCEEIASISREFGAETPFLRPSELAQDDTPDWPVFSHCLTWLAEKEGYAPDFVVHLRATSPFRDPQMIASAVTALVENPDADSVRGVCEPWQNPYKMWTMDGTGYLVPLLNADMPEPYNQPRQELPTVYWQIGCIDVVRSQTILSQRSMTGRRIKAMVVDPVYGLDIDNVLAFELAERWMQARSSR